MAMACTGRCGGVVVLEREEIMFPLPGLSSLTGGGGLQVSQNPVSGARDIKNDSTSGGAEGLAGSIVNNFSFGQSKLTSKLSGAGESSVLIWVAVGGAVLVALWWWKNRK